MEEARMLKGVTFRGTMEKVFDILEVADKRSIEGQHEDVYKDGVIQTEIIDKAHLGDNQLKEYLRVLTENDLLSFDSATCKFKITQKGHRFVQLYNKMSDLLKEGQEQQI
jgi:predicted transcriptional regulator